MKRISLLIKPASSLCTMRCRYCFYADEAARRQVACHGIMTEATMRALIDRVLGLAPDADIAFAFQGGEPTVAGLGFFRAFCDYVRERRERQTIRYTIQTNGLALDDAWMDLFAQERFLVGISLDGYREVHDRLRPDARGRGTYDRVMAAIALMRERGVEFNVLTVLSEPLARRPQRLYRFYRQQHIDFVQLIPCLPELEEAEAGSGTESAAEHAGVAATRNAEGPATGMAGVDTSPDAAPAASSLAPGSPYALTPRSFAAFHQAFFRLWANDLMADLATGRYMSVSLYDDLVTMFAGRRPAQCGMLGQCAPQFVVESSGDVYPCDFFALDRYRMGSIVDDTLDELAASPALRAFLAEPRRPCTACATCPFERACHRNCKRLNASMYDAEYCGYRAFLENAAPTLSEIARSLSQR